MPSAATPGGVPEPGRRVYLDSASGRTPHPAAQQAFAAALDAAFADPRRLHHSGRAARLVLTNARAATAEALGVRPDEVTFTSSGTEAVRRGLLGLHRGAARRGSRIVHTAVEHSSVLQAAAWSGATTRAVAVDATGRGAAGRPRPDGRGGRRLSVGQPRGRHRQTRGRGGRAARRRPALRRRVRIGRTPAPARRVVGAGGVGEQVGRYRRALGVLVVRRGARWREPFPEDERAGEHESGFENVPAFLGAAAALQAAVAEREEANVRMHGLVGWIRRVVGEMKDVEVVGDDGTCPHLVTFSCLYVDSEALVTESPPAGVRGGERFGLHVVDPGTQPRARRDGSAHARQRPGLGRARHDRGRRRAVPRGVLGVVESLRARV